MAELHVQIRRTQAHRCTTQEIILDGVRLRVRTQYVALTDRWYASLLALDGTVMVANIACMAGIDLLLPYKHLEIPQGQLFCYSRDREPPTFTTMDNEARVLYREAT